MRREPRLKLWAPSSTRLFSSIVPATLVFVSLLCADVHAQVVITEFMARNASTIDDEDGDSSDWIEVRNTGASSVSLFGYRLTDDAADPSKWVFPGVNLAAGEHLVVFASGKNRAIAGQQLHTNFQLSGAGEYLALIDPGGALLTSFSPQFPPQFVDVAYGLEGSVMTMVAEGANCEAFVPTTGALGSSWHQGSVSGWLTGVTPVGYERGNGYQNLIALDIEPQMYGVNASAYIRLPFNVTDPSAIDGMTLRMKYDDGFQAWINGVPVASGNTPTSLSWSSAAPSFRSDSLAVVFEDHDAGAAVSALQVGQNVLAIQGLNASATNIDFLISAELLGGGYGTQTGYLPSPTPGGVNDAIVSGFVEDVTISEERGLRTQPFTTTLACVTAGATIRYTTDGSVPTASNGTVYSGPISVNGSTVLRARGFLPGFGPSRAAATRTWIFPQDVFNQPATIPGLPNVWGGPGSGGPSITADYEMDPTVTSDPLFAPRLEQALYSHPVVSLAMNVSDWLDPATGIYISPTNDPSIPREVPTSVEYFEPNGSAGFGVDAGIRVTGNNSTHQWNSKKLSLRLVFRNQYGPGRLDYPLFAPPATTSFDTLTLDAYFAFTWNYNAYYQSTTAILDRWQKTQYLRDHFASTLHAGMGSLATNGKYAHLFINGVYWGLYNVHERPDADWQETYRGGDRDDWDVIRHNQNNVQDGNNAAWLALHSLVNQSGGTYVQSQAGYDAVKQLLDVENLADYMVLNLFIGFNVDWPGSNWYAARDRVTPGALWRMTSWDAEHTLKSETTNNTNANYVGSPARLYQRLRQNPEWRVLFGDRVHRFFFNDGPMWTDPSSPAWNPATPGTNRPAALYSELANSIEDGIILESARWGDAFVTSGGPYTLTDWEAERDRLLNTYFPVRRGIVLQQLRNLGLYPTVDAPVFSQHGGSVPAGFMLTMTVPAGGAVWFTTDGSDPRAQGGAVSATAQSWTGSYVLTTSTTVRARALVAGQWTALNEATFVVAGATINEFLAVNVAGLMDPAGGHDDWIEIVNTTASSLDLSGFHLTDDLTDLTKWVIPAGTVLMPGATWLVWADDEPFQGPNHATFKLSGAGEVVALVQPDGLTIQDSITFGSQLADNSTGRLFDGGSQLVTFEQPTPDAPNAPAACGVRAFDALNPTATTMQLAISGTPSIGANVSIQTHFGPPQTTHYVLLALQPADIPVPGTQLTLLLDLSLVEFLQSGSDVWGSTIRPFTLPNDPGLVGLTAYMQSYAFTAGGAMTGSNAVEVRICP